ncbi:bifunctional folylpolyglutamate synthase/dihydrofolate synthase [Rhizosphaericola mali]|uniref:Dihydrofolate synthase/folylpolyglutamate synthase n=1 Tax=Rhizosphaericola mali TaxID=2545455 RepID=A0A5P2G3K1_9BACT|nr:folylpolyglutamate synthase/dihydrofolate synthase family protein [Rhizosphaericola mali]QES89777.1 bifunctional folylpolyglutamate synthase/dihydrofolate synthase [Rhizosphaericola mali]
MNYEETLAYLYEQLPMFSRIGASAIKKDLTNTLALCEALGNPQNKFKTIHIAGTNGKGSTSHFLSAIFQTAGYKTGLYTSPHIKDFRERIRINGELCSKEFVVDFVARIKPAMEKIAPSFFEITVAMAFEYFAQANVDIAIIETGLGGRLDSTNVILPELSVITNIGWDHMDLLGDTLAKIAGEKAGIIKPNVPVVIGEYVEETLPVFQEKANKEHAPLVLASEERKVIASQYLGQTIIVEVESESSKQKNTYTLDLPGIYQTKNLLTVLAAIDEMNKKGWNISNEIIQKAGQNIKNLTGLHGRWEVLQNNPVLVSDVGHNKNCMIEIAKQIKLSQFNHLYIICGFVKDKDFDSALLELPADATYFYTRAHIPRALDETSLLEEATKIGRPGTAFPDVNTAIEHAKSIASKEDMILVCGSVFLVAEIDDKWK